MTLRDDTHLARAGAAPEFETRPSSPPVYLTTAFDLEDVSQLDQITSGAASGYLYTRDGNPNHAAFANDLALLERADEATVCSSGMGALTATLAALGRAGDHIVAGRVLYGRTGQLLQHFASHFGLEVTFVDATKAEDVAAAIRPATKLCLVESLTNPLLEVTDLPAIRQAIGEVPLLVDATFVTPILQKPLEFGATLVWHSGSKYLNGHGDVMLGAIAGPSALIRKIRGMVSLYGTNANPFECWLASRGMRTLGLRMQRVTTSATRIANWLAQQSTVLRVNHPSLASHPTHEVAQRVLPQGTGGMLSFDLPGGRPAVDALFRRLAESIPFSPTLADARTTFSYPAATSHKFMTAAERAACGIGDGLVRLSVGLEDPNDLIEELTTGLAAS